MNLETKGPLTFLPVRRPTKEELNNLKLDLILLTSPHGWDPYNIDSTRNITNIRSCPISHKLTTAIFNSLNEIKFNRKAVITPEILYLVRVLAWKLLASPLKVLIKNTREKLVIFPEGSKHQGFIIVFGHYVDPIPNFTHILSFPRSFR